MPKSAIEGIEPKILWERFYGISQVPRPSKKESKVLHHLKELLKELNVKFNEDNAGNILATVPAKEGYESSPTVVLQGHVDMVCEKNKDKDFDFDNDSIEVLRDDGWITADGTTLGSDNGIGVAAALAVITDEDIIHGPLELLFTVDEETGLTGANSLQPGFVKGKILLNMDSEEDGAFYIGCAGGVDTVGTLDIETETVPEIGLTYELHVTGLKGGHSGLDILTGRGNAIKILARALNSINAINYSIAYVNGGSLRNAIPREAEAFIIMNEADANKAEKIIKDFEQDIIKELHSVDADVKVVLEKSDKKFKEVFSGETSYKLVRILLALPHGVISMSHEIEGLVETSTNLATIKQENSKLKIGTSQRSSVESAKVYISDNVASIFQLANADALQGDGYPGWNPNMESNVLKVSKDVFKELFGKKPEIKAIHAGLECGILESKNPGMDMISFGPTIQGAHSPDERVNIETVEKFYTLLKGILKKLAS